MTKPLVSILMPVYNIEGLAKRTIKFSINHTYKNIICICLMEKKFS